MIIGEASNQNSWIFQPRLKNGSVFFYFRSKQQKRLNIYKGNEDVLKTKHEVKNASNQSSYILNTV